MENVLLKLETEFYFLTGIYLEGLFGLFLGLILFSSVLFLLKFEKRKDPIFSNIDVSNEIGDEKIAKINLSRSLLEMDQNEEAIRLLNEVLESSPNEEEKSLVQSLLSKAEI